MKQLSASGLQRPTRSGTGNDNTVAGVDSHRVEVFHVANDDTVVGTVPYNFIFNFLPACNALLQKNLVYEAEF